MQSALEFTFERRSVRAELATVVRTGRPRDTRKYKLLLCVRQASRNADGLCNGAMNLSLCIARQVTVQLAV